MVSASFGQDGLEDWEKALDQPDGHPLLATIGGCIGIVLLYFVAVQFTPSDMIRNPWPAAALAAGLALLAWATCWLLTLRIATPAWKIGSGVAFAGVALLVFAFSFAGAELALRRDAAMMRMIRLDPAGRPTLPPGMKAGPITQRALSFFGEVMDERHLRDGLFIKLGMDRIANASAVSAQPGLLRDCDRFASAKPQLDAADVRLAKIGAGFRQSLAGLVPDTVLRGQMIAAFDRGEAAERTDSIQAGQLQRMQLDLAGELCRFLAPHQWRAQGNMFQFGSGAQLGRFDSMIDRWNASVRGQQDLAVRFRSRMSAAGFDASGF